MPAQRYSGLLDQFKYLTVWYMSTFSGVTYALDLLCTKNLPQACARFVVSFSSISPSCFKTLVEAPGFRFADFPSRQSLCLPIVLLLEEDSNCFPPKMK